MGRPKGGTIFYILVLALVALGGYMASMKLIDIFNN